MVQFVKLIEQNFRLRWWQILFLDGRTTACIPHLCNKTLLFMRTQAKRLVPPPVVIPSIGIPSITTDYFGARLQTIKYCCRTFLCISCSEQENPISKNHIRSFYYRSRCWHCFSHRESNYSPSRLFISAARSSGGVIARVFGILPATFPLLGEDSTCNR